MPIARHLVLTLLLLAFNGSLAAATYYVALSGDDSAAGTRSSPWRTAMKAATSARAGDTVYFRSGSWNERLVPSNSGTEGAFITFSAWPEETVTFDGNGIELDPDSGMIDLSNAHHIRVCGLNVVHSTACGIYADGAASIVVDHCRTENTQGSGIGIWNSADVRIDSNEVVAACISGMQEHITVAGTDHFIVTNNHVHHLAAGNDGKEGICLKDGSSNGYAHHNEVDHLNRVGIYVDAWNKYTHDIEVDGNKVHDVRAMGLAIACETGGTLDRIRLTNNVAWNNTVGIWVSGCCTEGDPHHHMKDVAIVNNTCVENGYEPWGGGLAIENEDLERVVVRNNLLSGNLTFQLAGNPSLGPAKIVFDHNLIDGYGGSEGEIRGESPVEGDPRFLEAAVFDFRISRGSPAIDAGSSSSSPTSDYDGKRRPLDGDADGVPAVDIGAFENADLCRRHGVRR